MHLHQIDYGPGAKLCGCSLRKANVPVKTNVGKYVEAKHPKLVRKISAVLSQAAKDLAATAVKEYEKLTKSDADIVKKILATLNFDDVSVDIVDSITPELIRAFKQAGIFGVGQVGFSATGEITKQLDTLAFAYAEARGGELIKDLAGTTEDAMKSLLNNAVEEGMSSQKLSDHIEELGAFGEARADMIARTELAFAHVEGNVEGWRQTGEVEKKESILGDLHDVEDECDDCADAGAVGLEDDFIPGYSQPPYHPNCLCDLLPVLSEQADQSNEGDDE